MLLYRAYAAAIFFPCHPYIWSTTVLHDTLNEWGELAGHERLFNPPVLDLKARHSVFFIFSVIYILYMFLPFIFYFLSGCGGGLGPVGGGGGLLGLGPHQLHFLSLIVF